MLRDKFIKDIAISIISIAIVVLLCRFSYGGMALVLAVVGIVSALMRKPVIIARCFIMFPMIVVMNRALIGVSGITLMVARFAWAAMVLSAGIARVSNWNREKLPIGWLALYLAVSIISSIDGWMPLLSYLKIFNFALMLTGIYLLSQLMQNELTCLRSLRAMFFAISAIMILGSLITYFVPSVGFSMMLYNLRGFGLDTTGEDLAATGSLFNGMTCHSQMLSPVVACLATWTLCDMIIIERRMTLHHGIILACVPVLLYMSRSRGGLLMLVGTVLVTLMVTVPRARLPQRVKHHLLTAVTVIIILLGGAGVYFQAKNEAISRWLRKTDDVSTDTRTLEEAFTGSRQDSIAMNMRDFRINPFLGKGFQVMEGMKEAYDAGMVTWFSAAVEKGVTPYVILGETGILGSIAFLVFLWHFYSACFRRRYMSLMTNFTCFLLANLADSTFFSPSGLGGFMWMVACIGAFSTDCLAKQLYWMRQEEEYHAIQWR